MNKKTNPNAHIIAGVNNIRVPYMVPNHLKIFTPVGTAIIMVAVVK